MGKKLLYVLAAPVAAVVPGMNVIHDLLHSSRMPTSV